IFLLRSPFPGLSTCARSRPLVPPMPIEHGSLRLVEPLPALPTVFVPLFCLSRFHLPTSLGSTGITPLLRYYRGSVTFRRGSSGLLADHERRSFAVAFSYGQPVLLSDGDFHPAVGAHFQAHWDGRPRPSFGRCRLSQKQRARTPVLQ